MSGTKTAPPSGREAAKSPSGQADMFGSSSNGSGDGYTVLARRYRSRDFDELIGQDAIARTLQNAIARNRTAHAYLFCGTRGVGKTSMARIFAKAINVSDELEEKDAIARAILRGDDLDVIEIDGASNRGVQEARDLIASAGLSPTRSPYKIYIIDEVHMLTKDAFNALLKTMEEPPAHVKFILCTTEPQKIPATIQSRCQRFDFRAIPTSLIAKELRRILSVEGIEAEDAVIMQVARLGNGSMRDALSLLDRLIAAGSGKLTASEAEEILGLPDQAMLSRIIDAVIEGDPKSALDAGAELINRGATVEQALEQLSDHLRGLMIVNACGVESELLEMSGEMIENATRQAQHFDLAGIVHMIAICDAVGRNARGSAAGRALFDAALVQLCLAENIADLSELLRGGNDQQDVGGSKKKANDLAAAAQPEWPEPIERAAAAEHADSPTLTPHADSTIEMKSPPAPLRAEQATQGQESGEDLWQRIVSFAHQTPRDQAKIHHLSFERLDGRTLKLRVNESGVDIVRFLVSQADGVAELAQRATGVPLKVEVIPPAPAAAQSVTRAAGLDEVRLDPLVRRAAEIFDAAVIEVGDASAR